jgi:sortase A
MTTVGSEEQAAPSPAPEEAPGATDARPDNDAPPPPAAPGPDGNAIAHGIGIAVTLLAVLVLGFPAYLYYLSGLQEARSQTGMYATLQYELGQGTAPLGSPAPGTAVAVLNIPAIGLHNEVVVEGTSPENLTLGPGHLRDTALPGQYGLSVLYGRRATFGGPFARLPQVRPGDMIHVTTGQGTSRYLVKVVGDSDHRILIDPAANQLDLLTANSSIIPSHYIEVEANLVSAPQANPGGRPDVTTTETALANDPTALILTMGWGMALVIVAVGGTVLATRWARWPTYVVILPIALAVLWNLYQPLSALLPNLM